MTAQPRAARRSVTMVFFVHGAAFASWAARIPAVEQRLHLSTGTALGLLLSGPALGGLAGSQAGGLLLARFGGRAVTACAPVAMSVCLALIPLAGCEWALFAVLVGLGLADGITGVAMNGQGVTVQDRYRRPVLNAMHGFRSIGGMAGGAAAAAMFALGMPLGIQFPVVAAVLAVCVAIAVPGLLPGRPPSRNGSRTPPRVMPKAVVLIAVLAFLSSFVEDAPASWGGIYLSSLGASTAIAATAYAAFSGGETVGRLLSDPVVARIGWVRAVRAGAALCVPVFTAALVLGRPWPALVAFGICGAAISAVFPAAFAAAGRAGSASPAWAMAQVGFAGNVGWLAVSPAIGALAGPAGLPVALALLPLAAAAIAVLAPAVRPAENSSGTGTERPARRTDPTGER
ncbi:hypothetical protein COUCH_26725 [Couchioplanes caeruleus]|uniref:MFS transporter n=1 Tax=Couchioplanes caeruleus TaxID=56438 RepID=UPI0020C1594A|nr:MFS transporter [Couchioplanes caeruleus]UQU62610.1 hypothetical protein COUCH_26725 [Couchioplanes caeruleus]